MLYCLNNLESTGKSTCKKEYIYTIQYLCSNIDNYIIKLLYIIYIHACVHAWEYFLCE